MAPVTMMSIRGGVDRGNTFKLINELITELNIYYLDPKT